jgi:hypothetical protein
MKCWGLTHRRNNNEYAHLMGNVPLRMRCCVGHRSWINTFIVFCMVVTILSSQCCSKSSAVTSEKKKYVPCGGDNHSASTLASTHSDLASTVFRGVGSGSITGISNGRIQSERSKRTTPSLQQSTFSTNLLDHHQRTACSFYIWNAPSALLFRWCHHLQRDNIYEGRGGKKVSDSIILRYCTNASTSRVPSAHRLPSYFFRSLLVLVCSDSTWINVAIVTSVLSVLCRQMFVVWWQLPRSFTLTMVQTFIHSIGSSFRSSV